MQYLFYIEYASLNSQTALGRGVCDIADDGATNMSLVTGATGILGNLSGSAPGTDGKVSISYRGIENPWGNVWKWVDGGIVENSGKWYSYFTNDRTKYASNNIADYTRGTVALGKNEGYTTRISYKIGIEHVGTPVTLSKLV